MYSYIVVSIVILGVCENSLSSNILYDNDGKHPVSVNGKGLSAYGDYINPPRQGEWADWKGLGQTALNKAVESTRLISLYNHAAKNAIFMMGDGMGVTTVTAARVYLAQSRNLTGEDAVLSFENMPYAGMSRTYSTDQTVADSANTATAMMCGEKCRNNVICGNQHILVDDCNSTAGNYLTSVLHHAIAAGKWTGVISTDSITGASPAVNYAHSPQRTWEADSDVPDEAKGICPDIASQLIDNDINHDIRVLLGGGRSHMTPETMADPEYPDTFGRRTDGRNIIEEWQEIHDNKSPGRWAYVENITDFNSVDASQTDYLMGLFQPIKMQRDVNRMNPEVEPWGEPSVAEMVAKAIEILSRGPNGFFLFVESAQIDNGHHENSAFAALNETAAFSDAVGTAMEMTSVDDTLMVITADHSHAFTVAGYPARNTDIFGYNNEWERSWGFQIADDDKPYTTLLYTNGPGYYDHRTENGSLSSWKPRKNITDEEDMLGEPGVKQDSMVPRGSETHAGEDVGIYAQGPMSFLLQGSQEQSYIAHVLKYALCVGDDPDFCAGPVLACRAGQANSVSVLLLTVMIIFSLFGKYVY